ncbi:MAG: DUF4914 family protein [Fibrobacterota bacterium]|nr:DUF4914 family protein [Fibrobacterota bacterium]QQS04928.1 MAG: DUF4914 family protein [Fibrobacterota bacterium]
MGVINFGENWRSLKLPQDVADLFNRCRGIVVAEKREDLLDWALGREINTTDWSDNNRSDQGTYQVAYEVPGNGRMIEAHVVKAINGISVNYPDQAMRRRDPDAMVIADTDPTDKPTYQARFGKPFDSVRQETIDWLSQRELIVLPFYSGPDELGYGSLLICPRNAGFFAGMLADLQGFIPGHQVPDDFTVKGAIVFVAPPFRHTHFNGKQVVVHNRKPDYQEIFSYNLYPGPSAKKGIYSTLIDKGEKEGWVTNHCSAVQVETPYDNIVTFMHEGASGGGKSEMLEHIHRQPDGRLLLGVHTQTGEKRYLTLPTACKLYPAMDDMGAAHTAYNKGKTRLHVADAEAGWFIRSDMITHYGTDPHLEEMCINSKIPLLYLNHYVAPGGMCLLWEHTEDAPGKRCPNPRVVVPREMMQGIHTGPVEVNVRSFGVRCPPNSKQNPTYGIMGLFHIIPPSLAWLWRLVAPRGHANPSIVDVTGGMGSEGVGSYWPFCTGRRVDQANLLLEQIQNTPDTRNILIPNQHVGSWKIGFMSSWLTREYLARRGGARFRPDQLVPARSPLLGSVPWHMQIEGTMIPRWFLQPETQPEVGEETYDKGAEILLAFFRKELPQFNVAELNPLGKKIIQCCLDNGSHEDYANLMPF